jgi:hypothetical protein
MQNYVYICRKACYHLRMGWRISTIILAISLVMQSLAYNKLQKQLLDNVLYIEYIKLQTKQLLRGCK